MRSCILLSSLVLFSLTAPVSAWERTAKKECKKQEESCETKLRTCKKRCKQQRNVCKKSKAECKKEETSCEVDCKKEEKDCSQESTSCKKEIKQSDEASFKGSLGYRARMKYNSFTPEQKEKAMDYADNNKVSPDDAVFKVAEKKK